MTARAASYRLYGLSLRSRLVLPCPPVAGPTHRKAAQVRLVPAQPRRFARVLGTAARSPRDWFRCRKLPDGALYLQWSGLFEFLISADGRRIQYHRLERATRESFNTYLLSQVLSFSLLAFGSEPLHGTVVVVDGEAVAFVGECGYGKSTLGAAMLSRGFPILTDDLMAFANDPDGPRVHPGLPRLKLFPSVSRAVLGAPGSGVRMNPGTGKMVLPVSGPGAFRRPARLRAIYLLSDPTLPVDEIEIQPLSPAAAMVQVVRNSFNTIVSDRARLERQFRFARTLVTQVPVKRLAYPRQLSALPDVCQAILSDLKS